jgi:UPF0755 protein
MFLRIALRSLLVVLTSVLLWFFWDVFQFLHSPLIPVNHSVNYVLQPGANVKVIAEDLHKMGWLQRPKYFSVYARIKGYSQQLQAGEYELLGGMTPSEILQQFAAGKVIMHSITLVEGWNFKQVLAALNANPNLHHSLQNQTPEAIMSALGLPGLEPEGQFFPDTYRFTKGTADTTILQRAHEKFVDVFTTEWLQRSSNVPYTDPQQALIVASMIEKESRLAIERPVIADVILKRLAKGMLLQIDSTLVYGLGPHYKGTLHKADLRLNTPYNTYLHKGLPPTPIAMPSRSSIHAALHPWPSAALYFVARGDGSQEFSADLSAHNHAVKRYLLHPPATKKKTISSVSAKANPTAQTYSAPPCNEFWYGQNVTPLISNSCR